MKTKLITTLASLALFFANTSDAARIKDLTSVKGARDNQLRGVGLVVGLAGQGDGRIEPTERSIINAMERFGLDITRADQSRNVAVVFVTADIGPFAKNGSRIDVTVSSFGDADSLQGGTLLQTPLTGADNQVYAVAQGPVAVGGFLGGNAAQGATIQINHPTVGKIANGAIVEREIPLEIVTPDGTMNLMLRNPDPATAARLADAINNFYPASSLATDAGTINVKVPALFRGQETNFLASIGQVDVIPDVPARIIINEKTGTIVATQNVRISKVAVSHGSITVAVEPKATAVQPPPLAPAGTPPVVLGGADVTVKEKVGNFQIVDEDLSGLPPGLQQNFQGLPTLDRLTTGLNALGVTTREMTSILQAMKSAGALHAELILN